MSASFLESRLPFVYMTKTSQPSLQVIITLFVQSVLRIFLNICSLAQLFCAHEHLRVFASSFSRLILPQNNTEKLAYEIGKMCNNYNTVIHNLIYSKMSIHYFFTLVLLQVCYFLARHG